jgi:ribonuclease HII
MLQQKKFKASQRRKTRYEARARAQGYVKIAGLDEAGRGPLAGPVVAAACMIPEGLWFKGINDSKVLSADERKRLFDLIRNHPEVITGVGIVEAVIIDQINILQATLQAMKMAVMDLREAPDYILVDGNQRPSFNVFCEGVVKGDSECQSIMAAGILAKVTRDEMMLEFHKAWPQYHFDEHKGYGTEKHMKALKEFGPCPIHRMTFAPVVAAL